MHRPIIVKLINTQDKNRIFSSAKNLKTFNKTRRSYDEYSPYVYVTEHLAAKFQNKENYSCPNSKKLNVINNLLIGEPLMAIIVCLLMAPKLTYQMKMPKNVDYVNCNNDLHHLQENSKLMYST